MEPTVVVNAKKRRRRIKVIAEKARRKREEFTFGESRPQFTRRPRRGEKKRGGEKRYIRKEIRRSHL